MSFIFWLILIIVIVLISGLVWLINANKRFNQLKTKYNKIYAKSNTKVGEFLQNSLNQNYIKNLNLCYGSDYYYIPKTKTICIEQNTIDSTSIFNLTASAHEFGHAIDHKNGNSLIAVWYTLANIERFTAKLILPLLLVGLILCLFSTTLTAGTIIIEISVVLFLMMIATRIINIPTEKRASKNAIELLEKTGTLDLQEIKDAKKILNCALTTYILELFRYIFFSGIQKLVNTVNRLNRK